MDSLHTKSIAFIAVLLCACVPFRIHDSPSASGVVVDAATKMPIANATIQFRSEATTIVKTDESGSFDIPGKFKTEWMPLMTDPFFDNRCGTLVVQASDYVTREVQSCRAVWERWIELVKK